MHEPLFMRKNRNVFTLFLLLLSCCLFTSCFDLVEEIDLKNDGTGRIKATLNLSKSSSKVASLMKLKSVSGITIPTEAGIREQTETIAKILRATPGIRQVHYNLDFKTYIATLSCQFDNVEALNRFTETLAKHFKSPLGKNNSYTYNKNTRTLTRSYQYTPELNKEFSKLSTNDRSLFDDAFYTNIIRFDDAVKSQSHQAGKISGTKKAVLLKLKATDLILGKATLANSITLSQ